MPLDLPNQATIDSLTVRAKMPEGRHHLDGRAAAAGGRRVRWRRDLSQGDPSRAISGDNTLAVTIPVISEGLTPAQRDDRRRIDTTAYRYLVSTEVAGAQQADALEIQSFAITCTRS